MVSANGEVILDRCKWLINALKKRLVFFELEPSQFINQSKVFERINEQGVKLQQSDLLKNYLIEPYLSDPVEVNDFLDNKLDPLRNSLRPTKKKLIRRSKANGGDQVVSYPEDYFEELLYPFAILVDIEKATQGSVFSDLSERWSPGSRPKKGNSEKAVNELSEAAPLLLAFRAPLSVPNNHPITNVTNFFNMAAKFSRIEFPAACLPYFMKLARHVTENQSDGDKAVECLEVVESFLIRRGFSGEQSGGFQSLFSNLWSTTGSVPDAAKVKEKFLEGAGYEFPDDDKFKAAIEVKKLYPAKWLVHYVLTEYELSRTPPGGRNYPDQKKNFLLDQTKQVTLDVDHIVPTSKSKWEKAGDLKAWADFDAWRKKSQNTWANLALIESWINQKASNDRWDNKRNLLAASQYLSAIELKDNYPAFTETDFDKRLKSIKTWAINRWPR